MQSTENPGSGIGYFPPNNGQSANGRPTHHARPSLVSFGRVLRQLRKEAGLTQEQLALAAGIERNYVSLIERGINQLALKVIFKLAEALDTSPSKILQQVEAQLADAN